ncbi:hypothetical protein M3Y99_01255900 [Aphelenchoides fujianensis]|nr:hypothetical protein M3Y99_01255900 [Aphelenchoides fujianensis]
MDLSQMSNLSETLDMSLDNPDDSILSDTQDDSFLQPPLPTRFVVEQPAPKDPVKLAELRQACVKNCIDANREYQFSRQEQQYDTQTNILQETQVPLYPVALDPLQFGEHFKIFPHETLRKLPLNSVLDTAHLFPPRRGVSPPPIRVSDDELLRQERTLAALDRTKQESAPPATPEPPPTPKSRGPGRPSKAEKNSQRACTLCKSSDEGESLLERLLRCCQCQVHMHAKCAEMSVEMVRVVRAYNWCCADCKKCAVCQKPDQEAAMMCCDSCDRGFHYFCNEWKCTTYCKNKIQLRAQ